MPALKLTRRSLIRGTIGAGFLWLSAKIVSAVQREPEKDALTPEMFGAKGDGVTNDTDAFAQLATQVMRAGGGTIVLRRTPYLVGKQQAARPGSVGYAYEPAVILEIKGCPRPVVIRGNGARIQCTPGLRYGTFDRATGRPSHRPMPNYRSDELATPYRWMVKIENCTGPVEVADLELAGSLEQLIIGGEYDDKGRQIPGTGLGLYNNRGNEVVKNVYSHHHPLDGITVDGADDRGASFEGVFSDIKCEFNGRQGCSIVGGHNYTFNRALFNRTGKTVIASAPAAGVDIEAEGGKRNRNLSFADCIFSNNQGCGVVADQGDSEGITFERCTFIGATSWSAWPNKPGMRFFNCRFIGPIVNAFGDPKTPERATQFVKCLFLDDPSLSPTKTVYGGENPDRPIAQLPYSDNVSFKNCTFSLTHDCVLPWTTARVIFEDCTMTQRSSRTAFPRGTYLGRNVIQGIVDLNGAEIRGEVRLNGVLVPRSTHGRR